MPAKQAQSVPGSVPGRLLEMHKAIVQTAPGITNAELQTFLFLADNEGVSQRDVCEHLDIPQATASRALNNLNGDGHALVHCTPKGRHHELSVSPKGRQLLARLAVLLGCCCVAPASDGILSQFEIEPGIETPTHAHAPGYDACLDETVFSCDVS